MEIITGVFESSDQALNAVGELQREGLSDKEIGYLTPKGKSANAATRLPVSDTEGSGMGQAMGAAVGGAIGAAGGATLGLAAATLMVPGVGPVLAFGLLGAAVLGGTGAAIGSALGEDLEEGLGEGIPHEDLYLYEDTLRHGNSVVIVHATEGKQADRVQEILNRAGATDIDQLREHWWAELRDHEWTDYQATGRDFHRDELSYRKGFEAAQHPNLRGKSYAEAESSLREAYGDDDLDNPFRKGYERGQAYRSTVTESRAH